MDNIQYDTRSLTLLPILKGDLLSCRPCNNIDPPTFQRCFKCSQFLSILASMASSAVGIVTLLLVYVVAAAVVIASIEARNGGGGGGGRSVGGRQYFTPRRDLEGRGQRQS